MTSKSSTQSRENSYTDRPRLHPNFFLGSFHLLFWLFFHPSAWQHHVARIDAALSSDFALARLNRVQWRRPALGRLLYQTHLFLPILGGMPTGLYLWRQGVPVSDLVIPVAFVIAINLTLALMISSVVSVAAGIVGGVLIGSATGIVSSMTTGVMEGIASPTAVSIAIGIVGGLAAQTANQEMIRLSSPPETPKLLAQIGSIVIGILVGVVAVGSIRFGLTVLAGLATGLPENATYNFSRTIVVGASFGIALGWRRGPLIGSIGGLLVSLAYALSVMETIRAWGNLPTGLASGLLFGLSFGVTVVLPYVVSERVAGAWAGAWAGALGSWGRHVVRNDFLLGPNLPLGLIGISLGLNLAWWRPLLLYPFEAAWNLILYRLDEGRSGRSASLLRWHSACWDELQHLPLAGLEDHLLLVMERHPEEGEQAMTYLSQGHQRWAVQRVRIELEARQIEKCTGVMALSKAHQRLISDILAGPASALVRHFRQISQDIEMALNQTTIYHQRLSLRPICERLNKFAHELAISNEPYAKRFQPIAGHWEQVINQYLDQLAKKVEQNQEIDNPYIVGVPLTRNQEIFVGRTDIIGRIEQLLLDQRRPPLLLYGQRRMGKTSLLRNLGDLLPHHIVPLFVDGQRSALASDYADFLYNMATEMARSATTQRNFPLPPLSRETLARSPFTTFNEWLDSLEQTLAQAKRLALLTLDEFEMLEHVTDKRRFDAADILSLLRHVIQHRDRFKVMLAGSHTLEELQRWASYLINVQVIKVGYLAENETRQLIEQPVKDFSLHYQPEACQRVLDLTQGHPALVQLLCYEIVTLKNEQAPNRRRLVWPADVEIAVKQALASGDFFFSDIAQNQVDETGLLLLRHIARQGAGAIVSHEILAGQAASPDQFEQSLVLLLRRDLLELAGQGYRFQVELIRRWFEQV